jgi:hypothetical protein
VGSLDQTVVMLKGHHNGTRCILELDDRAVFASVAMSGAWGWQVATGVARQHSRRLLLANDIEHVLARLFAFPSSNGAFLRVVIKALRQREFIEHSVVALEPFSFGEWPLQTVPISPFGLCLADTLPHLRSKPFGRAVGRRGVMQEQRRRNECLPAGARINHLQGRHRNLRRTFDALNRAHGAWRQQRDEYRQCNVRKAHRTHSMTGEASAFSVGRI